MPRRKRQAAHLRSCSEISAKKRKQHATLPSPPPPQCEAQPGPSGIDRSQTTEKHPALLKRELRREINVPMNPQKDEYILFSKKKIVQLFENYKCKTSSKQTLSMSVRFGAVHRLDSQCEGDTGGYTFLC